MLQVLRYCFFLWMSLGNSKFDKLRDVMVLPCRRTLQLFKKKIPSGDGYRREVFEKLGEIVKPVVILTYTYNTHLTYVFNIYTVLNRIQCSHLLILLLLFIFLLTIFYIYIRRSMGIKNQETQWPWLYFVMGCNGLQQNDTVWQKQRWVTGFCLRSQQFLMSSTLCE